MTDIHLKKAKLICAKPICAAPEPTQASAGWVPIPKLAGLPQPAWGVLLTPALGAALMAASTVIVAVNAHLLKLKKAKE